MADPLSLATSVAGLISLSAQITSVLYTFASSALDARKSINRVLSEMRAMNSIFSQVQDFIHSAAEETPDSGRLFMISLSHLVATLTSCVLIFSELEKHINELAGLSGLANVVNVAMWEKLKWVRMEPEIGVLMEDLQRHKTSLNLMLGIIQCHSSSEAEKNSRKLHSVMQEILESNHAVSAQLRILMSRQNATIAVAHSAEDAESILSRRPTLTREQSHEFEAILRKSRPYNHTTLWNYDSPISPCTSAPEPSNWTMHSELSLGVLSTSDLSTFKLPIYPSDISNPESYQQQNFVNTFVTNPLLRGGRPREVAIETGTYKDEMHTSEWEPKNAIQETVHNFRRMRKQVFPWKFVRITDTDSEIFHEGPEPTRKIPSISREDMDSGKAVPEPPPRLEPASEHTFKAVAIRGTTAILRKLSVTRKQTDVDEAVTNHEDLVPELHTSLPAGESPEWDGSLRPVTWANWSPATSRRNSWSGPDQGELLVPEENSTARRHSVAADEALMAISTGSVTRGESNHPLPGDSLRSLQQQLYSFEFTTH